MKRFLPNLVLALALALCALSAGQWVREAHLRAAVASLQQTNQTQLQNLDRAESLARRYEEDIARLDQRAKELQQTELTNAATLKLLQNDLHRAGAEAESLRKQIAAGKDAVDRQNESIRRQNEITTRQNATILEQNETLKRLVNERNELVEKLNARTKEFNDVVEKYNDLVRQMEQLQKKPGGK